jgi:hypothetical protein
MGGGKRVITVVRINIVEDVNWAIIVAFTKLHASRPRKDFTTTPLTARL